MRSVGRGVIRKKMLGTEALRMDVQMLKQKGLFDSDSSELWSLSWQKGEQAGPSISCQFQYDAHGNAGLRFMYTSHNNFTGESRDFDYVVRVVSTPCNYGGVRWWFICPLIVNGVVCGRRCRFLYIPFGSMYLGCRECHELTYESRQKHRNRYYEGFHKPLKDMEQAEHILDSTRSFKTMLKAIQKIKKAEARIISFDEYLLSRIMKHSDKVR